MSADLVRSVRLKGVSLPRRRGHVNGIFGSTAGMPSGAPGDDSLGPSDSGRPSGELHRLDARRQVNLKRAHCAKVEGGVSGSTRDVMKTEPNPPNWEVLAGMVERVTYQNAENGFCVIRVKVRGHRERAEAQDRFAPAF